MKPHQEKPSAIISIIYRKLSQLFNYHRLFSPHDKLLVIDSNSHNWATNYWYIVTKFSLRWTNFIAKLLVYCHQVFTALDKFYRKITSALCELSRDKVPFPVTIIDRN